MSLADSASAKTAQPVKSDVNGLAAQDLYQPASNELDPGLVMDEAPLAPVLASGGRPRLVFLINSLEGGGAERVFSILMEHVQQLLPGADIQAVLLDDRPSRYSLHPNLPVTCLNSDTSFLDSALKFRRFLQQHRPHLVFSFLTRANYLAAAFAQAYGYRAIISERSDTHGRLGNGVTGWLKKQLVRWLYPRANRIVAVSAGIRDSLIRDFGIPAPAVSVIYNPYDIPRLVQLAAENNPVAGQNYILAVGRLVDAKRFDVLLRAYAKGHFQEPLVILGEGPKLAELQALAHQLNIASRVQFAGFQSNPFAVMARAAVYVLCSDLEGFPNALVEAMSLGCPVVATNCHHGPAEILDEQVLPDIRGPYQGKYGLLIPPGNCDAMAAALQEVLYNPSLRQHLARTARQRASHFTVEATVKEYVRVVRDELAQSSLAERNLCR